LFEQPANEMSVEQVFGFVNDAHGPKLTEGHGEANREVSNPITVRTVPPRLNNDMPYAPPALTLVPAGETALADCLRHHILTLLKARRAGATICPSEAARWGAAELKADWRDLMRPVRAVAAALAERGVIEVTQHGLPADIEKARGPVRLRLKQDVIG
jgi:hypothetical protein